MSNDNYIMPMHGYCTFQQGYRKLPSAMASPRPAECCPILTKRVECFTPNYAQPIPTPCNLIDQNTILSRPKLVAFPTLTIADTAAPAAPAALSLLGLPNRLARLQTAIEHLPPFIGQIDERVVERVNNEGSCCVC